MKRTVLIIILLLVLVDISAACRQLTPVPAVSAYADTTVVDSSFYSDEEIDSLAMHNVRLFPRPACYDAGVAPLNIPIGHEVVSFLERFCRIDTNYIEPQHYDYAFMLQNTNTFETYRITDNRDYSAIFSPEPNYKLGPYFGWRWIFLGYTFDINHIDFSHKNSQRQELGVSLYTNLFGIDLYYRKSGDDYKIRNLRLGKGVDTTPLRRAPFNGFRSSVKGVNFYYILNHHKFSYPAAFSQSTVQRRSVSSPLIGIAYTDHTVSIDWRQLRSLIEERMPAGSYTLPTDSAYNGVRVKYIDVSLSGGYAYNWVFARNFLLSASLSVAIAYKHSYSNEDESVATRSGFSFHNMGLDGIGRFALVYNNTKWYAGISSTFNAFNYNKPRFSVNTVFGNLNFYVGFNFGRKH